ncbi:hypothetical protein N7456_007215 [Penicillium angulare]|uniref:Uncharacterized protein n=1 Tax=Penicillium angulare TaxID=116970 RepID=A0A9W9FJA9_9EURO|nr:hypothetical protein N7456_007215 [Penicillium angulare]
MIGKDAVEQVVGEVKTPWMHDLASIMWKGGSEFRNCLGQLANYMRVHNVKYGFITTYHQTIFCKQDSLPKGTQRKKPGKAPEFALWYSDAIRHDSTKPIFLRECFLFLGIQIGHGNCKFQNPMSAEKWSSDGKGVFEDDDYISPDDTPEYAEQRQQRRGPRGITERFTRSQAQNAVAVEFGGRQPPQGSQLRAGGNQRGGQTTESQRHGYILEGERNRHGFHIVYRHREGHFFELRDNVPHPVTIDLRQNSSIGEWYYEIDGCRYYVDVRQLE